MRKFNFTEMICYLTLFNENRVIKEYNDIIDEPNYIYMTKNIDTDLKDFTPSKIAWLMSSGYFSMKSDYYIIDYDGNAVSVDKCNLMYLIERRLTYSELFKLCQKFGIEQDLR